MCGIVGYAGGKDTVEILLAGLRRLEYRGYDSAGLAVLRGGAVATLKKIGKVNAVASLAAEQWPAAFRAGVSLGIAHTRWATHGPPADRNAHPHLDQSGRIALVHNGIIENYAALKAQLTARGDNFHSETDTEVLAHLVGACYAGDPLKAVCKALRHVDGTFGIAVLFADHPDSLVVARRGSPLLVGVGADESVVASDAAAIVSHTHNVIYLDDNDVALVGPRTVEVRNLENTPVAREIQKLDWDHKAAEKGGYEHFMLKEIFEQPEALRNTIRGRLDHARGTALLSGLALSPRELAAVDRLVLVACGTSLHAGMVGKYFFEELADLHTEVEQAAEFRYRNPIVRPGDLVVAVSQSGETADTLAALREAKEKGAQVAGICNVVASTIAREAGRGIYLHAGPEIGVASTKAFTAQVTVLLMLALKFARCHRMSAEQGAALAEAVAGIPDLARDTLESNPDALAAAALFSSARSAFFIGRGILHPVALEGALKMKEISYIHAEGYHAAELKHGPIALLEEGVPVVALAANVQGKEKMLGNIQECRARNAPVISVISAGDDDFAAAVREISTAVLTLPAAPPQLVPVAAAILMQLLAYHAARQRQCDIDQPRNLAKSVTVE